MPELTKQVPPQKINNTYQGNKILPFVPVGTAGLSAVLAYKKGYGLLAITAFAITGLIIGKAIKNKIIYGNVIGWH